MRYIAIVLILSTFFLGESKADPIEADPVSGVDYQSQSVATVDRPLSGIINPAALGFWKSMGLQYAHSFSDSSYKGDDGFLLASKGAFFSVEWLNHDTDIFRRKYTLAVGDQALTNFYIGGSYSWFGGANVFYKDRKDWKLGLLYHPKPFASLALVVDRLNEPRFGGAKQKRLYQPGLGLRPFSDKVTLSADALWLEGEDLGKSTGVFRLDFGPYKGVTFVTDYRTNGQWRFNLIMDFQQTRLGGQIRYFDKEHYRGGTYFIQVGAEEYNTGMARSPIPGSITLKNNIVEEPRGRPIFGASRHSFYSVVRDLQSGADDPRIGSLLLRIEDLSLDFAHTQELRNAILEYRTNGKKVVAYLGEPGNLDYYLASACDRIYMNPVGFLELKGLSATSPFFKGALDKIGARAEILSTGPHKTFGDMFVDTTLTEAAREQLDWILDDFYAQFVDAIAEGRNLSSDQVKEFIDAGPYSAQDGYKAGLIDSLLYYDELTENRGEFVARVDLGNLYSIPEYNPRWSEPKKIAIVYADGSIVQGESGSSLLEGRTVGSETLAKALKKVKEDPSVKSVVFRVNSPGGDVFASEEIYRRLVLLREEKPVIVSMGGVAASGGYYISCPADTILALPTTITGSIGVVLGKVDLSGLYRKIGVNHVTIKRGRHADIRTTTRAATSDEIAMMDTVMWEYYEDFVNRVSTWRRIDYDSIDAIGEGRVWTGHQAKENGLVDGYGGILEAIELAREKANLDPRDKIEIAAYPMYGVSLTSALSMPSLESQISSLLDISEDTNYRYKMPYEIKVK